MIKLVTRTTTTTTTTMVAAVVEPTHVLSPNGVSEGQGRIARGQHPYDTASSVCAPFRVPPG